MIVPLHSTLVWPHPEYWGQCWAPQFIKDMKVLECIQSTATNLGKGLKALPSEEHLRTFGSHSLKKRRLSPYCSLQLSKVRKQAGDVDVFPISSEKMHGNGSKWHQRRCSLNWTQESISLKRQWNTLPREVPEACQCLWGIWIKPLMLALAFSQPWSGWAVGSLDITSKWNILFYS